MGKFVDISSLLGGFGGFCLGFKLAGDEVAGIKLFCMAGIFGVAAYCLVHMVLVTLLEDW